MRVELSNLKLLDFAVVKTSYDLVTPENIDNIFSPEIFNEYPIDIDYTTDLFESQFRVFMDMNINCLDNKLEGYTISVTGVGIFKFKDIEDISEIYIEKTGLGASAISITINNIRSYVMSITSYSPFGKYILPAIDLHDFLQKKAEQIRSINNEETQVVKKRKKITKK